MLHVRPLSDPGANEVGFLCATKALRCFHGCCPVDSEATACDAMHLDLSYFAVLQSDLLFYHSKDVGGNKMRMIQACGG